VNNQLRSASMVIRTDLGWRCWSSDCFGTNGAHALASSAAGSPFSDRLRPRGRVDADERCERVAAAGIEPACPSLPFSFLLLSPACRLMQDSLAPSSAWSACSAGSGRLPVLGPDPRNHYAVHPGAPKSGL
jgi:hypothetical protein